MNFSHPKKCITCHAGSRDAYQVSIALHEQNLLDCLVTDFYSPDFAKRIIRKRHSDQLPSGKVISLWRNLIAQKVYKQSFYTSDIRLSAYAGRRALRNDSHLFFSSYTAFEAFSAVKKERRDNRCLLFQLHPHPLSVRKILEEEIKLVPVARASILGELEMSGNHLVIDRLTGETALADRCVAASSFTRQTLIDNGIDPNNITVIPYGVDPSGFPQKKKYDMVNGKLNIIFVGQMIQRKGLYYLLEAIRLLNTANINLTIVGRGAIDQTLLEQYVNRFRVNVKINLSHTELVRELHANDVLVFPSLMEGFGHVILEAMSAGLPVICTPNTAGRDVFLTGNEGMIVPVRDTAALAGKIQWCCDNKKLLQEMGVQSAETARLFSWQKFRKEIVQFYLNSI